MGAWYSVEICVEVGFVGFHVFLGCFEVGFVQVLFLVVGVHMPCFEGVFQRV